MLYNYTIYGILNGIQQIISPLFGIFFLNLKKEKGQ